MLWGGWGERKRERAGHDFSLLPSSHARFIFFSIIAIFAGIPSGSLRGGESPGGYSHTSPIRVCAAQRGCDFEAPDLEREAFPRTGYKKLWITPLSSA